MPHGSSSQWGLGLVYAAVPQVILGLRTIAEGNATQPFPVVLSQCSPCTAGVLLRDLLTGLAYSWLMAWFPSSRSSNAMSGYPGSVWVLKGDS